MEETLYRKVEKGERNRVFLGKAVVASSNNGIPAFRGNGRLTAVFT
jgi:hypothetical protein